MMKIFMAVVLFAVSLTVQAQKEFTIRGKIEGIKDSTVLVLFRMDGDTGSGIGRDTVRNGTFCFRGQTEGNVTEKLSLDCLDEGFPSMGLDIWVAPGVDVYVSGKGKYLYTWSVKSPVEQQNIRNIFVENSRDLWDDFQSCVVEHGNLMMAFHRGDVREEDKEDANKRMDSLQAKMDGLQIRIAGRDIQRMKEMPVSEVWLDMLYGLALDSKLIQDFPYTQDAIAFYEGLTDGQKQTAIGKDIRTELFPPAVVGEGDDMADADLFDLQGNTHRLADYKGKYMLVDIWSAGCGPCVSALPEMKEITGEYKDHLTVISLSCDREKTWRKASQEHDMTWENLNELEGKNGLYARYGVKGIPFYLLISPEGKVIKKWAGYGKGYLKSMLQEHLVPLLP